MRGIVTDKRIVDKIIALRHKGYSYSEIKKKYNVSKSTLSGLLKDINLDQKALSILITKKYKSKAISLNEWKSARDWSRIQVSKIDQRDRVLILSMLYWGEGTKTELNIINGDPSLLKVFLTCLRSIGINEEDIVVALRIFDKNLKEQSITFWADTLDVRRDSITRFEFVEGKKTLKMPYGMCRVRLRKGSLYFKRIISMINNVKELTGCRSSMDRTRSS